MRSILSRPSRSYKDVEHDVQGLAAVGTAPYALRHGETAPGDDKHTHAVKTFRPSLAEMHFKKQAMHDPHPSSAFSPLPPAFNLGRKSKEQTRAGHRAEVNHMLEPEFQSARQREDDAASLAGPSRLSGVRTAGGLAALSRKKGRGGDDDKPSEGASSFQPPGSAGGQRRNNPPGVYVDSSGRTHDTEFDPFAGVAAVSRRKSKQRRSAFGPRRTSVSSGTSDGSSEGGGGGPTRHVPLDAAQESERDLRRRQEAERRQLDDVSSYAAARRQSLKSDRASGFYSGRGTPSFRSARDDLSLAHTLAPNGRGSRLSGHGHTSLHGHSAISPLFDKDRSSQVSGSSHNGPTARAGSSAGNEESPRKHTEKTSEPADAVKGLERVRSPERPATTAPVLTRGVTSASVGHDVASPVDDGGNQEDEEEHPEGQVEETGLHELRRTHTHDKDDAHHPHRHRHRTHDDDPPPQYEAPPLPLKKIYPELNPVPVAKSDIDEPPQHSISVLPRPGSAKPKPPPKSKTERSASGATRVTGFDAGPTRPMPAPPSLPATTRLKAESVVSATSSRSSTAGPTTRHRRPKERPREQLFPETPAQAKRREERERRDHGHGQGRTPSTFATDSFLPGTSRTRILPEIAFVADDDPRIVFPPNGPSTRIQHPRSMNTIQSDLRKTSLHEGASGHSLSHHTPSLRPSSREPSAIIEETGGGYLPTRWASGDRELRIEPAEKEMYRPVEWGGARGGARGNGGVRDEMKREIKDLTTNARFSLFRAKKKISRRTDL